MKKMKRAFQIAPYRELDYGADKYAEAVSLAFYDFHIHIKDMFLKML